MALWPMAYGRGEGEREERVKNSTGLKGVPVSALGFCRSLKGEGKGTQEFENIIQGVQG